MILNVTGMGATGELVGNALFWGRLGGSVSSVSDFGSGHNLAIPSSSPTWGSVLTAQSLEPASDSVSLSLRPSPARALFLSFSQKINKH